MRDLDEDASAVARFGIAAACASVCEALKNFKAFEYDIVRCLAIDVDNEAKAASIMFVLGIIQALLRGQLVGGIDWIHL